MPIEQLTNWKEPTRWETANWQRLTVQGGTGRCVDTIRMDAVRQQLWLKPGSTDFVSCLLLSAVPIARASFGQGRFALLNCLQKVALEGQSLMPVNRSTGGHRQGRTEEDRVRYVHRLTYDDKVAVFISISKYPPIL
jgi:hypothetical protein